MRVPRTLAGWTTAGRLAALAVFGAATAVSALAATDVPMLDLPMAFVLPRGTLESSIYIEKVNDTLDVFGVKQSQTQGLAANKGLDLGSIGDLDGVRGLLNFGLGNRVTLRYKGQLQDLQFGRGTLHRTANELSLQWNVTGEGGRRPALSLAPIYRSNRGSGISKTFDHFDAFGLTITPPKPVTLEFGGAGDETFALRFLASKRASSRLLVHGWFEFGKSEITSELHTDLPIVQIQDIVNNLEYSQHHKALGLAANWRLADGWLAGIDLSRWWLNRSIDAGIANGAESNDILHARLSHRAGKNAWITVDGQYYTHQLAAEVPFLYNRFTASRFDKVYGYLGLGVTIPLEFGS
ncbi:MAG: hypothetical protein HY303_00290 [Candidatus Wallbacteria bacterium]|nr:hypothetical protein [Candidatus Wallbacteria bacterium]